MGTALCAAVVLHLAAAGVAWTAVECRDSWSQRRFGRSDLQFFQTFTPKFRPTHTPDIEMWVPHGERLRGGLYGTVSAHAAISFNHCRIYGSAVSPVVVYGTYRGVGTAHGIQSDLSRSSLPDGYLSGNDSGDRDGRGCLPALYVADAER